MTETQSGLPDQKAATTRRVSEELAAYVNARRKGQGQAAIETERIPPSILVEALSGHARAAGVDEETVREILESVSIVRQKRAKAAEKAPKAPGRFSHQPTPEREAKAANGITEEIVVPGAGPVQATNRHRVRTILETYRVHFPLEEVMVLERFVDGAEIVSRANSVTRNYDGASGGGGGGKLGGLGNVPEQIRIAHTHHELVKAKLGPDYVQLAGWLLQETRFGEERVMTMTDVGNRVMPTIKDKATAKGISLGLLKGLAWAIKQIEAVERGKYRPPSPDRRVVSIMTEPVK